MNNWVNQNNIYSVHKPVKTICGLVCCKQCNNKHKHFFQMCESLPWRARWEIFVKLESLIISQLCIKHTVLYITWLWIGRHSPLWVATQYYNECEFGRLKRFWYICPSDHKTALHVYITRHIYMHNRKRYSKTKLIDELSVSQHPKSAANKPEQSHHHFMEWCFIWSEFSTPYIVLRLIFADLYWQFMDTMDYT